MYRIKTIEAHKNKKDRYQVTLEDGRVFMVHDEVIFNHGLTSGMDLKPQELNDWILDASIKRAYEAALRYLGYSARTCKQVEDYLKKKEFDQEAIDQVICKLNHYKFLNDSDYTNRFIHDKRLGKPVGRRKLAHDLRGKGIDVKTITEAVESISDEEEEQQAFTLAEKYYKRYSNLDDNNKRIKIGQALARRGFEWEISKRVMGRLMSMEMDD